MSIDPVAILAEMGVESARSIEPVFGGADTVLWRVEAEGGPYALRVFRPEQLGVDDDEVRAMEVARAAGLPVPRVERHAVWRDRPALLLSWCAGRPAAQELLADPGRGEGLAVELGRMQARMHGVCVPASMRGPANTWVRRAGPDELELQEAVLSLDLQPDALLHLDYHPLNVMSESGVITCILDWANADAGDPRPDVARTFTLLLLSLVPPGADLEITTELRRWLADTWWQGYVETAGEPIDMPLFYAWAGAYMIRDLKVKIGRPGTWFRDEDLDGIRRFTTEWKERAGLHI